MRDKDLIQLVKCGHPLGNPTPKDAGYTTREALEEARDSSPELRPYPLQLGSRGSWNWIYRKTCRNCPHGIWPEGVERR